MAHPERENLRAKGETMKTTAADTFQSVAIDTPAGRRLLRRIAADGKRGEGWRFRADDSTGWRVVFSRDVDGAPGDPRVTVTVETDAEIYVDRHRTGPAVRSFDDCEPVNVPAARYVSGWGGACRTVAHFLADGWRLSVDHSAGSVSSSRHGIAFIRLEAYRSGWTISATIDTTVCVDGAQVCSGSVHC